MVQPIFDYCDVVSDNLSVTQATRLQKFKNRAGRVSKKVMKSDNM